MITVFSGELSPVHHFPPHRWGAEDKSQQAEMLATCQMLLGLWLPALWIWLAALAGRQLLFNYYYIYFSKLILPAKWWVWKSYILYLFYCIGNGKLFVYFIKKLVSERHYNNNNLFSPWKSYSLLYAMVSKTGHLLSSILLVEPHGHMV